MKPTSIRIIEKLQKASYEAYWAGGCVRDILLGHEPKDYDIVTSAKPDEIEELLEKTKPVGKKFGVIMVIENKHIFEVATFRSDSGYSDGRRPDAVLFTDAKMDALRRDFTINGIFYDPIADKVYDFIRGQEDLDARLIRFIGDPNERILEDNLRIIRAVRFKNQLDFQYHPKTYNSILKNASLIKNVSAERIRNELNKMIEGPNPAQAFDDLSDVEVLEHIIPEMEAMKGVPQPYRYHHEGDVWKHSLKTLEMCDNDAPLTVKWACLLHDVGKPDTFSLKERIRFNGHVTKGKEIADKILKRLKFCKRDREEVKWLIEHHMMMKPLIEMKAEKALKWFLNENFLYLMQLFEADAKGTDPTDLSLYEAIFERYRDLTSKIPRKPKPLLNGKDVMKVLNLDPCEKVGDILEELEDKQLSKEIKTRAEALAWLKSLYKS